MAPSGSPSPKRAKLQVISTESLKDDKQAAFKTCQQLLTTSSSCLLPALPSTLTRFRTKNNLDKVRKLFDEHGFRTSVVMSPRPAISIYKDSCILSAEDDSSVVEGKEFLLTLLGMHPNQNDMEYYYSASMKKVYCLVLFCNLLRTVCPQAVQDGSVEALLLENEKICRVLLESSGTIGVDASQVSSVSERVAALIKAIVEADSRIRIEQLQHEFDRILYRNSTMSNAMLQLFLDAHDCCIKDMFFKRSHLEKYERITVFLYDPNLDELKPPRFTFLPSLHRALEDGPEALVQDMIQSFWGHLLRHGYFATSAIKSEFSPELEKYFLSGIAQNPNIPLLLNAHFTPNYALSFYLYGKAGTGKSSLVRNFSPAINATIEEHADPEILVRFVKQNLNKPFRDLQLELELRPNNNDLSVMSIIQGRRMTMTQSKPGLVVVDLEEMASNDPNADPNQLKTAQLISQRFSGRNGDFKQDTRAPRNSSKRGISGDASLITLFTSNYSLEAPCVEALKRLEMFANLKSIKTSAVSGKDRRDFAHAYLEQCVHDRFADVNPKCHVELDIPVGDGDTRPLVRQLRMLSFYLCALVEDIVTVGSNRITARIAESEGGRFVISSGNRSIELRTSALQNLIPLVPRVFDKRTGPIMEVFGAAHKTDRMDEISQVVDFFLAKTFAPAVIVSKDANLIKSLVAAVSAQQTVHGITGVDPSHYKIMKSLYDSTETPNLRNDILKFGRDAYVAVELQCHTSDAQLCIREIIEDSPSMTAFSTNKSALYKDGLFFGVYVEGDITPEVRSRASLIL